MAGHIFETWCFAEILKSYRNSGRRPAFYFYRDFDQVEIGLVIEQDGVLYPVEMKKSTALRAERRKAFLQTGKV